MRSGEGSIKGIEAPHREGIRPGDRETAESNIRIRVRTRTVIEDNQRVRRHIDVLAETAQWSAGAGGSRIRDIELQRTAAKGNRVGAGSQCSVGEHIERPRIDIRAARIS